jgi:hypothetical protein
MQIPWLTPIAFYVTTVLDSETGEFAVSWDCKLVHMRGPQNRN